MALFTDQVGRSFLLAHRPQRIISLVPSLTELLYSLGLEQQVVGITKFCVHPQHWFRHKTRIGGTKDVHLPQVHTLQPDLVIASKEENVQDQVEELARHYPVYVSDVHNLETALEAIEQMAQLTGTQAVAASLLQQITTAFDELLPLQQPLRTAYFIWRHPYMTAGHDTFIHDMLTRCGLHNIFQHQTRYPIVTVEQLQQLNCQLLLLSSEPYPFKEQHIVELQTQLPGTRIILADGEYFSWYGSRLATAPAYFGSIVQQLQ